MKLNAAQKKALQLLRERRIGSILTKVHGWVFPEDIRRNQFAAMEVLGLLKRGERAEVSFI